MQTATSLHPASAFPAATPCLYEGVPANDYHAYDAISASGLTLMARSPAHYRHRRDNPEPGTPAQQLGEAIHLAVLEPDLFEARITTLPADINLRTNAGKAVRDSLYAGEEAGIPLTILQRSMGHADPTQTQGYQWRKAVLGAEGAEKIARQLGLAG